MRDVYDIKTVKGMGVGMSDHMVVLCELKVVGGWLKKRLVDNTDGMVRRERLPIQREHEYMRLLVNTDCKFKEVVSIAVRVCSRAKIKRIMIRNVR